MGDVDCAYGWFVARLRDAGYSAVGCEQDRACCELATYVLRLSDGEISRAQATEVLTRAEDGFDFVTSFGQFAAYARGERHISAAEFLSALESKAKKVIFIDCPLYDRSPFRIVLGQLH